jgi:hypothetical protein
MACTLPCLKQFLAMFESGMIGEYSGSCSGMNTAASGYGYGYGSSGSRKGSRTDRSGSIALVEISRGGGGTAVTTNSRPGQSTTRHRPASSSSSSEIEIVLRPDHAVGDYSVASVSAAAAAADASSFVSDRSGAAMIIKKTQKWEVSSRERW